MLSCVGSRCWTRIKAMPLSAGNASTSFLQASRPPAEAPIPTTGKLAASRGGPRAADSRPPDRGRAALARCKRLPDILKFSRGDCFPCESTNELITISSPPRRLLRRREKRPPTLSSFRPYSRRSPVAYRERLPVWAGARAGALAPADGGARLNAPEIGRAHV